jgi:hypothetical protein
MVEFGRRFFALHASQSGGYAPSVLTGFVDVAEVVGRRFWRCCSFLEAIAKLQAYDSGCEIHGSLWHAAFAAAVRRDG